MHYIVSDVPNFRKSLYKFCPIESQSNFIPSLSIFQKPDVRSKRQVTYGCNFAIFVVRICGFG